MGQGCFASLPLYLVQEVTEGTTKTKAQFGLEGPFADKVEYNKHGANPELQAWIWTL